jgi:hypothetical protein
MAQKQHRKPDPRDGKANPDRGRSGPGTPRPADEAVEPDLPELAPGGGSEPRGREKDDQ